MCKLMQSHLTEYTNIRHCCLRCFDNWRIGEVDETQLILAQTCEERCKCQESCQCPVAACQKWYRQMHLS